MSSVVAGTGQHQNHQQQRQGEQQAHSPAVAAGPSTPGASAAPIPNKKSASVPASSSTAVGPSQQQQHQQQHHQAQSQRRRVARTAGISRGGRRRTFTMWGVGPSFSCGTRTQLWDAMLDGLNWCIESFIFVIGPLLILLALAIIALLTHTFFTIILPMMLQKHEQDAYGPYAVVSLHCATVVFLLIHILFNYFMCVVTRNSGPHYDEVVRELAVATAFDYPETPNQVQAFRRDYEDIMMLRMKQRQARHAQQQQQQQQQAQQEQQQQAAAELGNHQNGNMHRRNNTTTSQQPKTTSNVAVIANNVVPSQAPLKLRRWMLLGPFEWGYCSLTHQPKPPRSHYDHVTKKLVLNLDHYCPWMFNSIGYFNYRYFCNFLFYIFISMAYGAVLSRAPFFNLNTMEYNKQVRLEYELGHRPDRRIRPLVPFKSERMEVTLAFLLCTAVGAAVMLLAGFHLYLVLTAQTTIDFHGNWTNRRRAKQAGQIWKNPYSTGSLLGNWQQVYGSSRSWYAAFLIPSARLPEFLPFPIDGYNRKRRRREEERSAGQQRQADEQEALLPVAELVPDNKSHYHHHHDQVV